jgi:hypothetical protein
MKASKFIVFLAGVLGIIAFFLPLVSVSHNGHKATVSAMQLVKGLDSVQSEVDANHELHASMSPDAIRSTKDTAGAVKGIVFAVFVPALLLALIGGIAVARRKFQRLGSIFSLIIGLIGLAIAGLLSAAAEGDSGSGIYLLLLTGILGTLGGLLATIKPDRGVATA